MEIVLTALKFLGRIIDILLIAVILICAWSGYKKGLVMGIGGIIIIIVSVFGGNLLSNVFSYETIPALKPFANGYMDARITETVHEKLGIGEDEGSEYSIEDLLAQNPGIVREVCVSSMKGIGIYESVAQTLTDEAIEYAELTGSSVREAVVVVLCNSLVFVVGFLIFFLMIIIALTVIGNILNISFKLPNLDLVNDISGAVLGVITGMMFCVIITWSFKFLGIIVSEEAMSEMNLASWFLEKDYLAKYLGL